MKHVGTTISPQLAKDFGVKCRQKEITQSDFLRKAIQNFVENDTKELQVNASKI